MLQLTPNTTITGDTVIKAGAIVGPNTEIHNSRIDSHVVVDTVLFMIVSLEKEQQLVHLLI